MFSQSRTLLLVSQFVQGFIKLSFEMKNMCFVRILNLFDFDAKQTKQKSPEERDEEEDLKEKMELAVK